MSTWDASIASPREQREIKRRAILRVASRLFNERGFHGTSLDEIAEVLGVTKAALYYYVDSKEALLYECMRLSYDCGQQAREAAEAAGGSAYERLCLLYRRFCELLMSERGAYTTMANLNALPEDKRHVLLERRRKLDAYCRRLIQAAMAEGRVRDVDPRIAANLFLGAANWILRWHSDDGELTPAEIADQFVDLMLHGLARPA